MEREADGHFSVFDETARAGGRYWFRLDGERLRPDPAVALISPMVRTSRPPTSIPHAFRGPTAAARDCTPIGQVVYEMHVGTFTPEGTWARRGRASSRSWRASGSP